MSISFEKRDVEPQSGSHDAHRPTGALAALNAAQRELRQWVHDQLSLASLELRLASRSLMAMIAAAVLMGALMVLAWAGLMGAVGLGLAAMGLAPGFIMLLLALLTLLPIVLLRGFIRRRSHFLGFPATLRSLDPAAAPTHGQGQP